MKNKLSRKDFLRLFAFGAAGALVEACGRSVPQLATPTHEIQPTQTRSLPIPTQVPPTQNPVQGEIRLDGKDADIWAWDTPVSGTIKSLDDCQAISININGLNFDATLEKEFFSAEIPVWQGENRVTAVCKHKNGQETTSNMLTYTVPIQQGPKAVIRAALVEDRLALDAKDSQADEQDAAPLIEHRWSARPGNPAILQVQGISGLNDRDFTGEVSGERISLTVPPVDGEYYISLRVVDEKGRQDTSITYVEVASGKFRIPDYDKENPAWVENVIVYGVIPRNFGTPGFLSIMEKLDYLKDLGINALWLAPINVSPPGDYGYAVADYFNLNPKNGTKEDFHRLVQEAHARGIRVLMDFVPNHSSDQHPYFKEAVELGKESHYWDFYDRDEAGQPTHYFNWENLPNLNYDNPEVRRWMIEAFSYWIRDFDVDGFRVDVAWGIKERRPDFWPEWRRELKRIKPDLLLLAEASARDPYYFDNGFDVAYDWTDQLGKWAWELVWDSYKNRLLSYNLDIALTNRPTGFHPDAQIFRFLNNNDTGDRFITRHGEGMTRVSTALLLTLPGVPCIYTGDEVGEGFRPYYDPQPLSWEEKYPGLREYHQKLIALRKGTPSLHSRLWQPVEIKPIEQEVYGYLRYLEGFEQPVLVLLNFSEDDAQAELELPEEFKSLGEAGFLYDLLADERMQVPRTGALRIPVPGLTARILALKR